MLKYPDNYLEQLENRVRELQARIDSKKHTGEEMQELLAIKHEIRLWKEKQGVS